MQLWKIKLLKAYDFELIHYLRNVLRVSVAEIKISPYVKIIGVVERLNSWGASCDVKVSQRP